MTWNRTLGPYPLAQLRPALPARLYCLGHLYRMGLGSCNILCRRLRFRLALFSVDKNCRCVLRKIECATFGRERCRAGWFCLADRLCNKVQQPTSMAGREDCEDRISLNVNNSWRFLIWVWWVAEGPDRDVTKGCCDL